MGSAQLSHGTTSAFLHLLEQLAEDAWSQTLFPRLVAAGSAGILALTCSTMRAHVHSSVLQLRFQVQHVQDVNPYQLETWTASIPQHFPTCTAVALNLPTNNSYMGVSALLPALTRQVGLAVAAVVLSSPCSACR
jgi:hypothetical protein